MNLNKYNNIESSIFTIRNTQVMLDSELAFLYGTVTKFINRAVKRNPLRFPESFAFQLTEEEWEALRFQIGTLDTTSGRDKHRKYLPWVFTEQGVAMQSAVLNTETAILVSIQIMQAFVAMRKFLLDNLGASLKDLGKKWFAFSRMDSLVEEVLAKLKKRGKDE